MKQFSSIFSGKKTLKCKKNENFFCKENENFFSEVTKKLILFFLQTYREKQEKTRGNPEPFYI
jgi:hypothetical protein